MLYPYENHLYRKWASQNFYRHSHGGGSHVIKILSITTTHPLLCLFCCTSVNSFSLYIECFINYQFSMSYSHFSMLANLDSDDLLIVFEIRGNYCMVHLRVKAFLAPNVAIAFACKLDFQCSHIMLCAFQSLFFISLYL